MVDVNLGERQLAGDPVGGGELRVDGRDGAAGGTPVGEEVDGDVGGGGEEGLELGGGGDVMDFVGGHRGDWDVL